MLCDGDKHTHELIRYERMKHEETLASFLQASKHSPKCLSDRVREFMMGCKHISAGYKLDGGRGKGGGEGGGGRKGRTRGGGEGGGKKQ